MFDEKQEERVEALRKRIQNVSCSQAFFDLFLLFSNPNASKYHPADLKRAELEDWWLDSFLRSRNNDIDVAAAVFFECLKWRQSFGVHSIGFLELRAAFENAFIYFRGNDLDGNRLLWINFERCQPEEAVNLRLLVYWLERHTTDTENQPLALFINFANATASNMDVHFIKFALHALLYYYPCLKQIYAFDVPAKLSASWRLIRGYMDKHASENTVNLSSRNISSYVALKFIPKAVGGEDEFEFTISELARSTGSPNAKIRRFSHPNTQARVKPLVEKKKSVQFGQEYSRFVDNNRPVSIFDRSIDWQYRSFMAVAPKRSLVLNYEPNGENSVNLILQSNSAWFIYFNIGINSRRCLEVAPARGILEPTERTVVTIRAKESIRTPRKYKLDVCAIRVREPPDLLADEPPDVYRENAEDRVKFFYDLFLNTRQQRISEREFRAEERNGFLVQASGPTETKQTTPPIESREKSTENIWPLVVVVNILLFIVIYLYTWDFAAK